MTKATQQTKEKLHYLIIIGLICIVISLIYGYRTFRDFRHRPFPTPREVNVNNIQGWMTIHYISRIYAVPEEILLNALSITTNNTRNLTLSKVAKLRGKSTAQVIEEVKIAVQNFQKNQQPLPPLPPKP